MQRRAETTVFVLAIRRVPGYVANVPINAAERAHPVTLICLQLERNFRAKGLVASRFRNETTGRAAEARRHNGTVMKRSSAPCDPSMARW